MGKIRIIAGNDSAERQTPMMWEERRKNCQSQVLKLREQRGCSAPELGVEQPQNRHNPVSGRKPGRKQTQAAGEAVEEHSSSLLTTCFLSEIRSKQLRVRNRGGMLAVWEEAQKWNATGLPVCAQGSVVSCGQNSQWELRERLCAFSSFIQLLRVRYQAGREFNLTN